MEPWTNDLILAARCHDGDRVLDVACGTGKVASRIGLVSGKFCSITGIDLNEGTLSIARRNPPIDWHQGSATVLPNLISQTALAYYSMSINLTADSPLKDGQVRAALEASIDRGLLNRVVFDGQFIPSNQFAAPGSRYWDSDHPTPARDLAKAKGIVEGGGAGTSGVHTADWQQSDRAIGCPGGAVLGG